VTPARTEPRSRLLGCALQEPKLGVEQARLGPWNMCEAKRSLPEIEQDAVRRSEIATDGVGSLEIAENAVGASEIGTDSVGKDAIGIDEVGATSSTSFMSTNPRR